MGKADINKESRRISLKRADNLKSRIDPYLEARKNIRSGLGEADKIHARQADIKKMLGATDEDWDSWQWQIRNRIKDSNELGKFINLTEKQKKDIDAVGENFRWAISPYFLSLIDVDDDLYKDPTFLQSVPIGIEINQEGIGEVDPMGEEFTNPASCITRRYPDRLIINVTNQCGMYCRHCQRRRNIGEIDAPQPKELLQEA